jgi:type I restriction enzyme S subunit
MNKQTARLLEQHFDTAFGAPDGIAKLRELILTLAMQGRLVEQDPGDPPASELLKEIQAEKQRLVKAGKIKKPKPLPPIKPEEVPYELPKGWEWVRLGNIGDTNIGLTYSPSDVSEAGIPVLRSNNIQNGMLDFTDLKRVNMNVKESVIVQQGDLLICARNGSRALVGKTALIKDLTEKMAFGAFMAIFRSQVNLYLLYFINSSLFRRMIDEVNTMTINQITQNNLKKTICPLPPLPEQHRIVARIDQLMARCDELETLRKEREEKRLTMHAAAINQLLDAPDGSAWNFIQQHFGELYTVKENVAELRKTILQLAVMGRLVPQNPDDPPASELLKEIKAEKQRLVKAGKIKKSKPLPPIKQEEVPYELPQEWEWVRLGDLFRVTSGKNLPKDKMQKGDIPVFGGNGITGYHNESNVIKPTVVIGRVGYYCGSIHLTPENAWITDNAFFTIYDEERLFQDFVIWLLKTINLQVNTSATAQPVISGSKIYPIPVPLPPFPEQQRIVIKIDQLMTLCDTLEKQIEVAINKQSEMLNAVMAGTGG